MHIETASDTLRVRMGATFGAPDVTRLQEAVAALGPFTRLTIDFAAVRQCDDSALERLARALLSFSGGELMLKGLTLHQWRLLTYLGIQLDLRGAVQA